MENNAIFVRPVAQNCYDSLMLDIWPNMSAIVDFGLASTFHYGALQFAIKHGAITAETLDKVLGDGPSITALCESVEGQPYHAVFATPYDNFPLGAEAPDDNNE